MSAAESRIGALLQDLVVRAGDARDVLATGDWEGAAPLQDAYDEAFAQLQHAVQGGLKLEQRHAATLRQLRAVNEENRLLVEALRQEAHGRLTMMRGVRRAGTAYAPLGTATSSGSRYVDGAA